MSYSHEDVEDPVARKKALNEALNGYKDNPSWLDKVHGSQDVLRTISDRLRTKSGAFFMTGNLQVADELFRLSETLDAAIEKIGEARSQVVDENLASSQAMTKGVLEAVLAGAQLERQTQAAKQK